MVGGIQRGGEATIHVEHRDGVRCGRQSNETYPLMQIPKLSHVHERNRRKHYGEKNSGTAQALFPERGVGATVIRRSLNVRGSGEGLVLPVLLSKEDIPISHWRGFHALHVGNLDQATGQWPGTDWGGKLGAWVKAAATGFLDDGPLVSMFFDALRTFRTKAKRDRQASRGIARGLAQKRVPGSSSIQESPPTFCLGTPWLLSVTP